MKEETLYKKKSGRVTKVEAKEKALTRFLNLILVGVINTGLIIFALWAIFPYFTQGQNGLGGLIGAILFLVIGMPLIFGGAPFVMYKILDAMDFKRPGLFAIVSGSLTYIGFYATQRADRELFLDILAFGIISIGFYILVYSILSFDVKGILYRPIFFILGMVLLTISSLVV